MHFGSLRRKGGKVKFLILPGEPNYKSLNRGGVESGVSGSS